MKQKIFGENSAKKLIAGIKARFVSKKDISESTGDATDKVMSQKAVSHEFNRLYGLTEGSAWETKPYTGEAYTREIPKNSKIASVDMIGGKSFVWNQIVKWDQSNPSSVTGPASMSVTHDGELYTGTRIDSNASIGFSSMVSDEIIGGHVYYFACDLKVASTAASMLARFSYSAVFDAQSITYTPGSWTHLQAVQKAVATPSKISLALYVDVGAATKAGDTFEFKRDSYIAIDLTRAFGAGNEPDSPEKVVAALGLDATTQHPYCAGEVRHAAVESVVTSGNNLWDEEWEIGAYHTESGVKVNTTSANESMRSVNKIPCKPNTSYYMSMDFPGYARIFFFDKDGNFISYKAPYSDTSTSKNYNNPFVTPSNCFYITLASTSAYGNAYRNDISIYESDVVSYGYTPYRAPITQPLPAAVLALPGYGWSAGTAKNHIYRDGKRWLYKQEVDRVDLGSQTFVFGTSGSHSFFSFAISRRADGSEILTSAYGQVEYSTISSFVQMGDQLIGRMTNGAQLAIHDTRYSSTTKLKAALAGEALYFKLATPLLTDITDLMGDTFAPVDLSDEFGSITFENSQKAAIPNTTAFSILKTQTTSKQSMFAITEDMCTVTQDPTKGVAPYSTSYGMTYIEIDKDAGVEWVEGGIYTFPVSTKLVVDANYRNVAIRIGGADDGDVWHPFVGDTGGILAGHSYLAKSINRHFIYKTTYQAIGALHMNSDTNTTYAYLVNTYGGAAAGSPITIDSNGYGAKLSLIFPTTKIGEINNERWSSLVKSSSNGTTKAVPNLKFYADRNPIYLYSANVAAGAKPTAAVYQDYNGADMRYTVNTNTSYMSIYSRVYLWLKNFDPADYSFEADAGIGAIMTQDKIATKFPSTTEGDVYLYYLGVSGGNWYGLQPEFAHTNRIFKYTPSTGEMIVVDGSGIKALPSITIDVSQITDPGNPIRVQLTDVQTAIFENPNIPNVCVHVPAVSFHLTFGPLRSSQYRDAIGVDESGLKFHTIGVYDAGEASMSTMALQIKEV